MKQPTDAQWEAVRETRRHLLVNAGAGTGKTSTVVAKILYLLGVPTRGEIIDVPLRLADIAAITYTNRAAADLKRKLREALRAAGRRDLAYEIDRARIGTIHSFCGDVLREFALRGGYDPPGRILQEGEAGALTREAAREAIIEAVEEQSVAGLSELLTRYRGGDVEKWVAQLAGDVTRLRKLRETRADARPEESALLDVAESAWHRLHARLDALRSIDFDRMIADTRDLIADNAHVRAALQRRIHVLVVDEFQDVDPAQKEIAYLLGDPESQRTDTPRLMLVGDPKQSIYRFRRADVTVWTAVQDDFAGRGLGRVVELRESFRTVQPILSFVEATVGKSLAALENGITREPYEVEFLSVRSMRDNGPTDLAVELFVVPPDTDGKGHGVADVRRADAAAIARRMVELHDEGVAWKDMALLLVSWNALDTYAGALEAAGIPAYALQSTGYFERREILDLIVALETIRNPRDDRALLGFLRSPFVGVRDETLLEIVLRCRERDARSCCWDCLGSIETGEADLVAGGRALIGRYIALRDRVSPATLLRELIRETGYVAHLALFEEGDRAIANVRKFLADADAMAEGGVGDLLRAVAEQRDREDKVAEARLFGAEDDVVTITSVHSAKGLEWKVVFWSDLCRDRRNPTDRLVLGRESLRLSDPDLEAKDQPPEVQELRAQEIAESVAEQKRLWYVASTRAADRLILSGIPFGGRDRNSPAEMLRRALPELASGADIVTYAGEDGKIYRAAVQVLDVPDSTDAERVARDILPLDALPPVFEPVRVPSGRGRLSATAILTHGRCERKYWFKYVLGLREPQRTGTRAAHFESAVVQGQIFHDVLEHMAEEQELDALLDEAIGRWAEDAPPPESMGGTTYRKKLLEELRGIAEHPEYRALADVAGARNELSFVYLAPDGHRYEGAIDLAAPGDDGYRLLDVKTGRANAGAASAHAARYAAQRELYVLATESIAQAQVAEFDFFFSGPQEMVRQEMNADARAAALHRIVAAGAAVARGGRDLARDAAECRYCGYLQAGWCPGVKGDSE